jgi:hypothetical protein
VITFVAMGNFETHEKSDSEKEKDSDEEPTVTCADRLAFWKESPEEAKAREEAEKQKKEEARAQKILRKANRAEKRAKRQLALEHQLKRKVFMEEQDAFQAGLDEGPPENEAYHD